MEPFVYAPVSMLGNWTNVFFLKFPQLYYQMLITYKELMEPFVYAPASMIGNWANVFFLKFLQLYYQMLPIKN